MISTQSRGMKKSRKKRPKKILGVTIDYNMPDYPLGPSLLKKIEEGRKCVREIGLPDWSKFK